MCQYFLDMSHGAGSLEQSGSVPTGTPRLNYKGADLRSLPETGLALRLTIWKGPKGSKNSDKRDRNVGAESKRMFCYLGHFFWQLKLRNRKT